MGIREDRQRYRAIEKLQDECFDDLEFIYEALEGFEKEKEELGVLIDAGQYGHVVRDYILDHKDRITIPEVARRRHMSQPTAHKYIKYFEEQGTIEFSHLDGTQVGAPVQIWKYKEVIDDPAQKFEGDHLTLIPGGHRRDSKPVPGVGKKKVRARRRSEKRAG